MQPCKVFVGFVLGIGCTANEPPTGCYEVPEDSSSLFSVRDAHTIVFVLDDSRELEPYQPQLKQALLDFVQTMVNPPCVSGLELTPNPSDPFGVCPRGQRFLARYYWHRNWQPRSAFSFAFVRGSRQGTPECDDAYAQHAGVPLAAGSQSDGVFHWRPQDWDDPHSGAEKLEMLLGQIDDALQQWEMTDCAAQQPLEAVYQLFIDPEATDPRTMAFREHAQSTGAELVFISGTDDQSADPSGLLPIERYANLMGADGICLNSRTLSPLECDAPVINPFGLSSDAPIRLRQFDVLGPAVVEGPDCPVSFDGLSRVDPRVEGSRLTQARQSGVPHGFNHALCIDTLDSPVNDAFMAPLLDYGGGAIDFKMQCGPAEPLAADLLDADPASPDFGRVACRAFQVQVPELGHSCECEARGLLSISADQVPRGVKRETLEALAVEGVDPNCSCEVPNCLCEVPQLSGVDLERCRDDSLMSEADEPTGFCYVDADLGLGKPDATCPLGPRQFRVMGWNARETSRTWVACLDQPCQSLTAATEDDRR